MKEKRFAVDYLVPTKGKFIYFVLTSSVGLFLVVLLYSFVDGIKFSFVNSLIVLSYCLVISSVIWSIAYLVSGFKKNR